MGASFGIVGPGAGRLSPACDGDPSSTSRQRIVQISTRGYGVTLWIDFVSHSSRSAARPSGPSGPSGPVQVPVAVRRKGWDYGESGRVTGF